MLGVVPGHGEDQVGAGQQRRRHREVRGHDPPLAGQAQALRWSRPHHDAGSRSPTARHDRRQDSPPASGGRKLTNQVRHRLCPGSPWDRDTASPHFEERCRLRGMMEMALSIGEIARRMGRHRSTIRRELARADGDRPDSARRRAWARKLRGSKIVRSTHLGAHVEDRLCMGWSPEQIAGRMELRVSGRDLTRCSVCRSSRSSDFSATNRIVGRVAASAIASRPHRAHGHRRGDERRRLHRLCRDASSPPASRRATPSSWTTCRPIRSTAPARRSNAPEPPSSSFRRTPRTSIRSSRLFAKIKALLRKAAARTPDALEIAIAAALDAFLPNECANYFTNQAAETKQFSRMGRHQTGVRDV